jgi:hypothetical protein
MHLSIKHNISHVNFFFKNKKILYIYNLDVIIEILAIEKASFDAFL